MTAIWLSPEYDVKPKIYVKSEPLTFHSIFIGKDAIKIVHVGPGSFFFEGSDPIAGLVRPDRKLCQTEKFVLQNLDSFRQIRQVRPAIRFTIKTCSSHGEGAVLYLQLKENKSGACIVFLQYGSKINMKHCHCRIDFIRRNFFLISKTQNTIALLIWNPGCLPVQDRLWFRVSEKFQFW